METFSFIKRTPHTHTNSRIRWDVGLVENRLWKVYTHTCTRARTHTLHLWFKTWTPVCLTAPGPTTHALHRALSATDCSWTALVIDTILSVFISCMAYNGYEAEHASNWLLNYFSCSRLLQFSLLLCTAHCSSHFWTELSFYSCHIFQCYFWIYITHTSTPLTP